MVKSDERLLHAELTKRAADADGFHARQVARELGIPEKRAAYILGKWSNRGWWEYGVNVLAGWFTDEGKRSAPLTDSRRPRVGP